MSRRQYKRRDQHHVRLYDWEIRSDAYRSLSCWARALLVEFRSLYTGQQNHIYMSAREIQRRLGISQRPADRALKELLDRGFIVALKRGSFTRKARHASEYALTNEPFNGETTARKTYMQWKCSVASETTNSSARDYRAAATNPAKPFLGSARDYRDTPISPSIGSARDYTDRLPGGTSNEDEDAETRREARAVGDSIGCPCGGQTTLAAERWRGQVLLYQRCGGCERCARYVLKCGSDVLAIGAEAQRQYLAAKGEAA